VKRNLRLPRERVLADGSYLTTDLPQREGPAAPAGGVRVRVVEYRLEGIADAEPLYRLVTTILDPARHRGGAGGPVPRAAGRSRARWPS
jgi:hypothetical protein